MNSSINNMTDEEQTFPTLPSTDQDVVDDGMIMMPPPKQVSDQGSYTGEDQIGGGRGVPPANSNSGGSSSTGEDEGSTSAAEKDDGRDQNISSPNEGASNNEESKQDTNAMIEEAAAAAVAAAAAAANPDVHLVPPEVDALTAAALAAKTETMDYSNARPDGIPSSIGFPGGEQQHLKRPYEPQDDESFTMSFASSKRSKRTTDRDVELALRRKKDRERYANMTEEQRKAYNAKRRAQYHRQNELSRQRRRERERSRYHGLTAEAARERNARRAKLERERYQRLSATELEARNRRRRERAAAVRARSRDDAVQVSQASTVESTLMEANSQLSTQEQIDKAIAARANALASEAINEAMKAAAKEGTEAVTV